MGTIQLYPKLGEAVCTLSYAVRGADAVKSKRTSWDRTENGNQQKTFTQVFLWTDGNHKVSATLHIL